MRCVVLLSLVFSMCQASVLTRGIHNEDATTLNKILSRVEKTQLWNTLQAYYKKAHEWLWGKEDGFITNFFYKTGGAPNPKCKCCCRRKHLDHFSSPSKPKTSATRTYDNTYYIQGDQSGTGNIDNGVDCSGGCCFGGSNSNSGSIPIPPVGNGPQIIVSVGNDNSGSQANGSGSGDCSGCTNCVSGFLSCLCNPDILCCCCNLFNDND